MRHASALELSLLSTSAHVAGLTMVNFRDVCYQGIRYKEVYLQIDYYYRCKTFVYHENVPKEDNTYLFRRRISELYLRA
ncbi:hypothetical protein BU23DRAFT_558061 [Bimuria novae-zelandiae CBS 107.79]|uniref:Secreted protein n=1 Tax=Bimuria novae-zelandiae CBS 107.79 TaxID=1447943 RepID=A0A6A5UYY1_9PLEO|nr:hypothetical protein BU23DRAFT_558061 [Bimuria novae-zelandiae CBS 107.79]